MQTRKAGRHLSRIYDSFLRPCGIRSTQYGLLSCVENLQTPSISEISSVLSMEQTTVSRNILKLKGMGLVETVQDADNRHRKIVTLTDSGREALARGRTGWEKAQAFVKESLGDSDYAALARLMARLSSMPESQA